MELSTITMEPEAAKAAFEEYAAAVRAGHDEEDQAIADGYKALAEGKPLINLPQTLAAGGVDTIEVTQPWRTEPFDGDRATPGVLSRQREARLHPGRRPRRRLPDHRRQARAGAAPPQPPRPLPDPRRHVRQGRELTAAPYLKAIVPNIPPRLRPKRGLQLYTLLWEAEWAVDPLPPSDPALLRQLGGDLYIVLGTWDLTALEQAVLSGRA